MKRESFSKYIKAAVAILSCIGVQFSPESVDAFTTNTVSFFTGVFAVIYALEGWWKDKKGK